MFALIVWETAGYTPQPEGDLFQNAVHNFVQAILGIHVLDAPIWRRSATRPPHAIAGSSC
jgi:hypothetical protein